MVLVIVIVGINDMNERIRELEIEAIAYADSKVPWEHRYNDIYYSIVRGKFAELLIQECTEIAKEIAFKHQVKEDTYSAGKKAGAFEVAEGIKQHFGVDGVE